MRWINILAIATILGFSTLQATNYRVDSTHSEVEFKVKHMMISSIKGTFGKFSGTFNLDEKNKKFFSLEGMVDVNSINTKVKDRDKHLKGSDFFDVKKYSKMTLKLLEQNGNEATVELTIKDVTKRIKMYLDGINGPVKDPWGNIRSAFELHGKINRKDFNINFNKLLETGGLLVDDYVNINITIEGIETK